MENVQADNSADWIYYSKEVPIFRVSTRDKDFFITASQCKGLRAILEDPTYKDRMVFFGEDGVKAYMIVGIYKENHIFHTLPDYVKSRILREAEIFPKEVFDKFSDSIKSQLIGGASGRTISPTLEG